MKVITIVGARPQFIKAAVVSRALRETRSVCEVIVHTGQHYDRNMSEIFFDELDIPRPALNLGIGGGSHGQNTGRMIEALEAVLIDAAPAMVLVYGDTDSTLAGALAAAKLHLPVVHVEAGLRSGNRRMPEEINRLLTDRVADLLFAPAERARRNLLKEGVEAERIHVVGDVMYDATLYYAGIARDRPFPAECPDVERGEYALATIHRAENVDTPALLHSIMQALAGLADRVPVILPLHPRTRTALQARGALQSLPPSIHVTSPLGYLDMMHLEQHARLIVTDSGGVQKEACFHRVPCVTLRQETEWTELVEQGWNLLAPPGDAQAILGVFERALQLGLQDMPCPYGDGRAGHAIAAVLSEHA